MSNCQTTSTCIPHFILIINNRCVVNLFFHVINFYSFFYSFSTLVTIYFYSGRLRKCKKQTATDCLGDASRSSPLKRFAPRTLCVTHYSYDGFLFFSFFHSVISCILPEVRFFSEVKEKYMSVLAGSCFKNN